MGGLMRNVRDRFPQQFIYEKCIYLQNRLTFFEPNKKTIFHKKEQETKVKGVNNLYLTRLIKNNGTPLYFDIR